MNEYIRFNKCNVVDDTQIVTLSSDQDWCGAFFDKPPTRLYIGAQKVQFDYFGWDGSSWLYFCKENSQVSLEICNDLSEWRSSLNGWAPVELDESGCRVRL